MAGSAKVAFLKPLAVDAATHAALISESRRIYSFIVAEQSDGPPHLVVRVEFGAEATGLSGSGRGDPGFVARGEVAVHSIGLDPRAADFAGDEYRHGRALGAGQLGGATHDEARRSGVPGQVEDQIPP